MLKMIEDEIYKIINEEKTIYVLKGFDSIIKSVLDYFETLQVVEV